MAQNNDMVMSWLKPLASQDTQPDSKDSFLDLPIVPQGAGLSAIEDSSRKISDFMKVEDGGKIKKESVNRATSKPMQALLNKMRDSNRQKVKKHGTDKVKKQPQGRIQKKPQPVDDNSDSDSDSTARNNRTVKRGGGLSFTKKRPF